MVLLFTGIHNAWDIAVWMSLRKHKEPAPDDSKPKSPADGTRAAG